MSRLLSFPAVGVNPALAIQTTCVTVSIDRRIFMPRTDMSRFLSFPALDGSLALVILMFTSVDINIASGNINVHRMANPTPAC